MAPVEDAPVIRVLGFFEDQVIGHVPGGWGGPAGSLRPRRDDLGHAGARLYLERPAGCG